MSDRRVVVDTDVLSALMRGHSTTVDYAGRYLARFGTIHISVMTIYEMNRGLLSRRAVRKIERFQSLVAACTLLPVDSRIARRAAEVYANLKQRGAIISDADILIAATALVNGFAVATNNESHFRRVPGLDVVNWMREEQP